MAVTHYSHDGSPKYYSVESYPGIAFRVLGHLIVQEDCQGHPDDGEFNAPIGETFYCDGSCEEPYEHDDFVKVQMVGDNKVRIVDIDELTLIDEDDVCGCGQIGCNSGGWN